jgi:hypothetical protein
MIAVRTAGNKVIFEPDNDQEAHELEAAAYEAEIIDFQPREDWEALRLSFTDAVKLHKIVRAAGAPIEMIKL